VAPYPDLLQRKLFSPFQSPPKKKKQKQKRRINPNFVSSSPLQSSCCITSKTKLRKQTWKNTCKKFQEIEKQNKDPKKKEHEK
jgi:hypothetical protein